MSQEIIPIAFTPNNNLTVAFYYNNSYLIGNIAYINLYIEIYPMYLLLPDNGLHIGGFNINPLNRFGSTVFNVNNLNGSVCAL